MSMKSEKGNDDATKMLIQHITMLNVTNLGQQSCITKFKINKKMMKEKVIQHMPTKCNPFYAVEKKYKTFSHLNSWYSSLFTIITLIMV